MKYQTTVHACGFEIGVEFTPGNFHRVPKVEAKGDLFAESEADVLAWMKENMPGEKWRPGGSDKVPGGARDRIIDALWDSVEDDALEQAEEFYSYRDGGQS